MVSIKRTTVLLADDNRVVRREFRRILGGAIPLSRRKRRQASSLLAGQALLASPLGPRASSPRAALYALASHERAWSIADRSK